MAVTGVGRHRVGSVLTSLVLVPASLAGCSHVEPDAAVVRVTITHPVRSIDSRSACVVRLRPVPRDVDARAGEVVDCLGPQEGPRRTSVSVPAGHYLLEVGQWGCPGTPGDCPDGPYDDLYRGADRAGGGGADWYCSVDLTVAARQEVSLTAAGPGRGSRTTCQQA